AGILYTAYRIRVNQLLRVERIRNSIASDLHDEVSATLSSISYFAQAIQSDKVTGDKNRFVRLIADSAGDAKEKITDIVWAINPEHDDWTGFLSKCRRYASDLLESKNISYSLKITEHIPGKLDMQLRQHLWLIFKEMVTNAARHSEANNLDIIIKVKDGMFSLVVQDDGTGMDVDGVKKGNGLININKRAELIGAEVDLRTSEGFGTRWKLNVRV
ncbi:MAG TPA: histidine kinase, partial [Balneolaceae bacterium]|nr:histidine kinase [Balneolaceae bacterium]